MCPLATLVFVFLCAFLCLLVGWSGRGLIPGID